MCCMALEFSISHELLLIVTGTFFLMSAIRQSFGFDEGVDLHDLNCSSPIISHSP